MKDYSNGPILTGRKRKLPPPRSDPAFDRWLGIIIGNRPCDGCGKRLGNEPRRVSKGGQFHPACLPRSDYRSGG